MNIHQLLWGTAAAAALLAVPPRARGDTLAQFRTSVGNIDVQLFDQEKPVTVQNFVRYVQSGAYTTNLIFHRYVPNFVMQGGGFYVTNRGSTNEAVAAVRSFGTIRNEFSVGPRISNTFGTIAMAKVEGNPDSATSQWFFNLKNNSELDANNGGFTVFGQVIRGTTVLNQFTNLPIVNAGGPLGELPVRSASPTIEDVVFVNITLLTAEIRALPDGKREIGWISVKNKTNRVEFSNRLPPVWKTLATSVGDGNRATATDSATNLARIYRIRVDY